MNLVGQMGFQSHSFYSPRGFSIQQAIRERCDITERDWDWGETNPSNQPNQPSLTGGASERGATQ